MTTTVGLHGQLYRHAGLAAAAIQCVCSSCPLLATSLLLACCHDQHPVPTHLPTLMSTLLITSSASSSSVQDDPIATPCMFSRLLPAGAAAAAALLPASTVFRPIKQPWSYHTCTSCRRCCFAASPAVSSNQVPQVPLPNTPLVLLNEAHCAAQGQQQQQQPKWSGAAEHGGAAYIITYILFQKLWCIFRARRPAYAQNQQDRWRATAKEDNTLHRALQQQQCHPYSHKPTFNLLKAHTNQQDRNNGLPRAAPPHPASRHAIRTLGSP